MRGVVILRRGTCLVVAGGIQYPTIGFFRFVDLPSLRATTHYTAIFSHDSKNVGNKFWVGAPLGQGPSKGQKCQK